MSQPADLRPALPPGTRETAAAAVLVGVDGSEGSGAAIEAAAREARYRGAPLVAMQAYCGERTFGDAAERGVPAVPAARDGEDERVDAESSLRDALRAVLGERAADVEAHAVLGLAGRRIIETARQVNAQLIVLATRGSTSLLLGTVSQYVLRKAPCPVLIVPAPPARPAS